MLVIWLGALLVLGGLVFMAAQPIWRGRMSGSRSPSPVAGDTLEPQRPVGGFGLAANLPGIVMVVLGAILLLVGGAF